MKSEKGITLMLCVAMLPVLIMVSALALDTGMLYVSRNQSQNAADAAALAGAYSFVANPNEPQPVAEAQAVAGQNTVLRQPVVLPASAVVVDVAHERVTVTVAGPQPAFFARIFGLRSVNVGATATAEASPVKFSKATCLKPVFAPQALLNGAAVGSDISIRPLDPSGSLASGQYYDLDFTSIGCAPPGDPNFKSSCSNTILFSDGTTESSSGASAYNKGWTGCEQGAQIGQTVVRLQCGQWLRVQTGIKGKNLQKDTNQYTDQWLQLGRYQTSDGIQDWSGSINEVPVWSQTSQITSGNTNWAEIVGFAEVFIDPSSASSTAVTAHLVTYASCDTSPSGSNGPGVPEAVKLVQNPQ